MFIPPFLRLNLFFNFIEHVLHGKLGEALGSLVHRCCAVSGVADTGGVGEQAVSTGAEGTRERYSMTDTEAQTLRKTWQQWGSATCRHMKRELESNERGYLTGDYHCTECGELVAKKLYRLPH